MLTAYPRETQEMVFDAHNRVFAFFKGARTRGIYDNMKTAIETVFIGKDRLYNRRFPRMCGHCGTGPHNFEHTEPDVSANRPTLSQNWQIIFDLGNSLCQFDCKTCKHSLVT